MPTPRHVHSTDPEILAEMTEGNEEVSIYSDPAVVLEEFEDQLNEPDGNPDFLSFIGWRQ